MIFPLTRNLAFFKFLTSFFLSFFLHEHKPCFYSGEKIYLIALDQTSTFFIYLCLLSCISSHNSCIIVLESRLWKKKAFMAIFSHNFFLKNFSLKSFVSCFHTRQKYWGECASSSGMVKNYHRDKDSMYHQSRYKQGL